MWQNVRLLKAISNFFLLVFFVIAVGGTCIWFFKRSDHAVRVVKVQSMDGGSLEHVNDIAVKNMAVPEVKGNFYTVNLEAVRAAFEKVPWVHKASVRREWPDKLVVSIEEHHAVGPWGDGGDRLLSEEGEVFTVDPETVRGKYGKLRFYGPDGSGKEVITQYQAFAKRFAEVHLIPVTVKLSDRYAWSVTTESGLVVLFGREDEGQALKTLLDRFVKLYPRLNARYGDAIASIDMRYRNGVALRLSRKAASASDENSADEVREADEETVKVEKGSRRRE